MEAAGTRSLRRGLERNRQVAEMSSQAQESYHLTYAFNSAPWSPVTRAQRSGGTCDSPTARNPAYDFIAASANRVWRRR